MRWWPGENYPTPGCEWSVESLVASGGRILTCDYAGYPSWYAKLNTKVVVDTGATVAESDEANNTLIREISVSQPVAATAPDLYVSEFALNPTTPTQGKPVAVRVGVYNKGTAPAGPFTVRWWPGENYPTPGCEWPVESLVASGGRILTCNYTGYPSWYAKLNTKVVVDTGATVAESDEANNTLTREISVNKPVAATAPDLYVSEFALNPTTPTQGKPVAVRVGVYNKGTAPAGPFTVRWWPGENYPTPGCEWPVESLVASGGRILTCDYAGYPSWYAKLNTKVVVDTGATVAESDEANNTLIREISV